MSVCSGTEATAESFMRPPAEINHNYYSFSSVMSTGNYSLYGDCRLLGGPFVVASLVMQGCAGYVGNYIKVLLTGILRWSYLKVQATLLFQLRIFIGLR